MAKRRSGKRYRMTKFRIDEASYVDRPAQAGATALFMKREGATGDSDWPAPRVGESCASYVKRFCGASETTRDIPDLGGRLASGLICYESAAAACFEKHRDGVPILTDVTDGHAHIVWLCGERGGETTYQGAEPDGERYTDHSHPWTISTDGTLIIAENHDHAHAIDQGSVQAAMRELLIESGETPVVVADVVFARSADGVPVDAKVTPVENLIAWIDSGEVRIEHEGSVLGKSSMPDGSYPIRTSADLVSAIASAGTNPQADVARHIVKRARVLDLEDEGIVALVEIAKSAAGPAGAPNVEVHMTGTTKGAKPDKTDGETISKADHDKVVNELAVAKQEATLSDRQRAHYVTLKGDEATAFLSKKSDERDAVLDAMTKGDAVVYKSDDGTEFRKSDDPRLVTMAKQRDADRKELLLEKAAREQATLEKRAADELGNLGGELSHRAALLRAVDSITDETVRKGVAVVLASANTAAQGIFTKRGTKNGGPVDGAENPVAKLDAMAKAKQKEAGFKGNYYDAYEQVSNENPELAKAAITGSSA